MTTWLFAIILGFVEGLTEFIPVSSTGHLLIAEHLLKIDPASFLRSDLFNVVIQAGAVLAVLPLFKERIKGQLRMEIFNLLNRTNWANPTTTFTSSSFGQLTQTKNAASAPGLGFGEPRNVQLAMKIIF